MLKKIALCASVLTLSAIGGGTGALAYDAPANSFYPAAGWDVSTMPSDDAGKNCLLIAEYNNGFFVQFQGKDGALELISFDLRQPAFETGQSVPVTLTIPGKTSIQITGSAFNEEVLILDMSGQDALLETLRSASAMDIDIDGNAFRFFLTGFANAVPGFDRCNQPAPEMAETAPVVEEIAQEDVAAAAVPEDTAPDVETAGEKDDSAAKIATGEPVRTAPSENMKRRQQKEQEKYEAEIARIMPREDSVTADLQRQMEESGQTLADVEDTSARPQRSASRYTEKLAIEMGTPVAGADMAEPVRSISAEKMALEKVDEPEQAAPDPLPAQAEVEAEAEAEPEAAPAEVIDLAAIEQESAEKEVEMRETTAVQEQSETAEMVSGKSKEKDKSLIEDLKDFIEDEPEDIPPAEIAAAPPKTPAPEIEVMEETFETDPVQEQEDDVADTAPAQDDAEMISPPVTAPKTEHIASTPDMKVTKTVTRAQADFTGIPVDAAPSMPPAMKDHRISELEAKLEMLKRENDALNTELEMALQASEKERLDIASDNWNLEQATMRYNEAERQILNLGQQIQKERAQCAVEKKELEMMLFDPQLTEQAQLAHLAKLEDQLEAARAEIDTLRAQLGN